MSEIETTLPDDVIPVPSKNGKYQLYFVLGFLVAMFMVYAGFCWWVSYNPRSWVRDPQWKTVRSMYYLAKRLGEYREKNGEFPDRLEKLYAEQKNLDYARKYELSDGWKRPLNYETDGKTWRLSSYGSDGKPGGIGVETDIHSDDTTFGKRSTLDVCVTAQPTLKQIFVKKFFENILISSIIYLVYLTFILLLAYYFFLPKKQTPPTRLETIGGWIVAVPFLIWLNYMLAVITMIPSAQK